MARLTKFLRFYKRVWIPLVVIFVTVALQTLVLDASGEVLNFLPLPLPVPKLLLLWDD